MVAGLLDQVVQPSAFTSQYKDAIGLEVELGVVRRSALVESKNPDMLLLHLFERADKVSDTSNADMLRGSRGGLRHCGRDRGRAAFRQDDSVDSGPVGGAKQRAKVMWILDAVERKEETMSSLFSVGQKVFNAEKLTFPDDCQHALMGIGAGDPGELVAGFERDTYACGAAELDQPFKAFVAALAGHAYMVKLARTGTDSLLDRVKTVQNFHR
jgi:hypothetical protein